MCKVVAKISQLIIFFFCDFFGRVWNLVLMWIRIYFAHSADKGDHLSGLFGKNLTLKFSVTKS